MKQLLEILIKLNKKHRYSKGKKKKALYEDKTITRNSDHPQIAKHKNKNLIDCARFNNVIGTSSSQRELVSFKCSPLTFIWVFGINNILYMRA